MNYSCSAKSAWVLLENYLEKDYELGKIMIEDSKSEGWRVNYQASDKSLCYIHPEIDAFIVVFQIQEEKIDSIKNELSKYALKIWDNRYPCGKGGWIRYKVTNENDVLEVRKLLNVKIKPKKRG